MSKRRTDERDPVEARGDGTRDLYDVATWEPRTSLDRLSARVYRGVLATARAVVILVAIAILLAIIAQGIGATFTNRPGAVALVVLSVVPALALAAYVYVADVTTSEPLELLVGTFVLGVLFAGFAAVINSLLDPLFGLVPVVGTVLFFYLVVGPVEETVKWLAVRLLAFRSDRFDAVIDGAVYGAAAGLGFATIENALYITRNLRPVDPPMGETVVVSALALGGALGGPLLPAQLGSGLGQVGQTIASGSQITALRALAGPGHVIYSAFAGYYLGLAKFNREHAGPIVVKGLLIAAFIHGTYNTLVGIVPAIVVAFVPGVSILTVFFGFVVVYDGVFGYILYRKIRRYRRAYKAAHDDEVKDERDLVPELTEFDG